MSDNIVIDNTANTVVVSDTEITVTDVAVVDLATTSADGLMSKEDKVKLDSLENQTAAAILTKVKTVDGASSGLDADLLDGQEGSYYTNYADTAVNNLVDSAPDALNTLNELAAALNDDANFSATVTTSLAEKLPLSGGQMTGNITMSGSQTVDGRDISADGAKLDGIEAGATADQTATEIRALVESASNSNVFTDADHSKLDAIEANATADQTASEIEAIVNHDNLQGFVADEHIDWTSDQGSTNIHSGNYINTTYSVGDGGLTQNNFTDTLKAKLDGVEAGATADQTDAQIRAAVAAATDSNVFTDADHTKLDAIEANATADQTASEIEAIVNHDNLQGFVSNEHIDWTTDQGSTNIHSGNYINTTYSVGDGGLTQKNFTTTLKTKLDGIEAGATADQTDAEIRAAVEAATDSNVFTDADHSKLNAIEASADVTDTANVVAALTAGTNVSIANDGTISATDTNTTYTSSDFNHDDLTGFVANEHIDWTASSAGSIHLTNLPATALTTVQTASSQSAMLALTTQEGDVVVRSDENKTYMHNGGSAGTMADFTLLATPTDAVTSVDGATGAITLNHDTLTGFVANEHIDWTADQGATNIHAGNYVNTTYSVGDGGLTQNNFTDALKSKLDGIEAAATADQTATEIRALVESASDSNVFTDADHSKLDGIASSANNYSHPNHSGEVTSSGDGATTIADNVVDEANLKVSNAPTDGYVLTARSGNSGGLTWEATAASGMSDLVDDTTPQLGGDLDVGTHRIETTESQMNFEVDSDASSTGYEGYYFYGGPTTNGYNRIWITGTETAFQQRVGSSTAYTAFIQNNNQYSVIINEHGGNHPAKITNWGNGSSAHLNIGVRHADAKVRFTDHTGNTLRYAFPNSTPSSGQVLTASDGSGTLSWAAVSDSTKMPLAGGTFSGDVTFTGASYNAVWDSSDNALEFGDDAQLRFGAGTDLFIKSDGSNSIIQGAGTTYLRGSTVIISANGGSGGFETGIRVNEISSETSNVELYYDNSKTFETSSSGVSVIGSIAVSGTVDGRDLAADGSKLDGIASSANNYVHPNHSGEVTSTADGATVIADNVVDEANLKVSNSPTDGYVLTAQSGNTGGLTWAEAAGSDPDLYADNYDGSATKPNASASNSVALGKNAVSGGGSSIAFGASASSAGNLSSALGYNAAVGSSGAYAAAIGQSYANGSNGFAASIANNSSSYGATGSQAISIGYLAKATGGNSAAIGFLAQATNSNALAMMRGLASGQNSIAIGYEGIASAKNSVAIGRYAKSETQGKYAFANGDTWGQGKAQSGHFVLKSDTTDATAEALTTNKTTADATNQVVLPNNSVYGFTGTVIARENSAQTNDFAVWEIKGGAVRAGSASTTALGSYNINKISESTGAANWSIGLSADTTNGAVAITVTGEASHSIRWVATVNTTEVTY